MKLRQRIEHVNGAEAPDALKHVIIMMESQSREEALDLYGRHRIAHGDSVVFIVLYGGDFED